MARRTALVAPLVFFLLAAGLVTTWSGSGRYRPTGDEPHYLVMADGLVRLHALEQTGPYARDFRERQFWPHWPPAGTPPTPENGPHVVAGPHGLFNVHNVGLPVVLAVPVGLAGTTGARLALIFVSALLAWLAAAMTPATSGRRWRPVVVGVVLTCSLPFLTGAGQVYPDLGAGVLYLAGCCGLLAGRRRPALLWVPFVCAACLPWLQVKNSLLAVLLVAAGLARSRSRPGRLRWLPAVLPVLSGLVLLAYNSYAYGRLLGPYGSDALAPGLRAVQTGLGLVLDQDQGLLFQNPLLLLAGVAGLVTLWARDRLVASATGAGALLVLTLNAMHPVWYGGTSFAGRFMWTSAAILVLPAALLLQQTWQRRPALTRTLLGGSVALQAVLLREAALTGTSARRLYAKPVDTFFLSYSSLLRPVSRWLPALYDPAWAWRYLPNYLWLAAGLLLGTVAVLARGRRPRALLLAGLVAAAAVVVGPVAVALPRRAQIMQATPERLPSTTGRLIAGRRLGVPGRDAPGLLAYGFAAALPAGSYVAGFTMTGQAPEAAEVAVAELVTGPQVTASAPVRGSFGRVRTTWVDVTLNDDVPELQARVRWDGVHPVALVDISLAARPVGRDGPIPGARAAPR